MKTLMMTTLAAALAVPAVAGAQEYTFALVPKAMNNPFFDLARDGCKQAEAELSDVTCKYIGPSEHTELEQIQIVQDLISEGVDGIGVSPSNAPAMANAVEDAREAGIPVITWEADLLPEYEARIAALERLSGRQALEIEFLKGAHRRARSQKSAPGSVITGPPASPSDEDAS